jgi:microsomal dipeptidase-like Zn-dependent dipeptidase
MRTVLLGIPALAVAMAQSPADSDLERRARAIHERVITLDTHVDIDARDFTSARNYASDLPTRVNLPKMFAGGLDAAFFVVYTEQGPLTPERYRTAYEQASAKFDAIHRLTREIAPDKIGLGSSRRGRAAHRGDRQEGRLDRR